MADNMDVNAGRVLEAEENRKAKLDYVGREIFDLTLRVVNGKKIKCEELGHQEFILTYKKFEPIGPAYLPRAA